MRLLVGLVVVLGGCDAMMPEVPEPTVTTSPYRYGIAHWESVDTDCLDDAWTMDESVMAEIDGETITLWFETMPELTGTLSVEGQASVAGTMTFPDETGNSVSCVVDGTAVVSGAEVAGEMHERLSSAGPLNCDSRGRYTIRFTE